MHLLVVIIKSAPCRHGLHLPLFPPTFLARVDFVFRDRSFSYLLVCFLLTNFLCFSCVRAPAVAEREKTIQQGACGRMFVSVRRLRHIIIAHGVNVCQKETAANTLPPVSSRLSLSGRMKGARRGREKRREKDSERGGKNEEELQQGSPAKAAAAVAQTGDDEREAHFRTQSPDGAHDSSGLSKPIQQSFPCPRNRSLSHLWWGRWRRARVKF